jgi:hypothetical protein
LGNLRNMRRTHRDKKHEQLAARLAPPDCALGQDAPPLYERRCRELPSEHEVHVPSPLETVVSRPQDAANFAVPNCVVYLGLSDHPVSQPLRRMRISIISDFSGAGNSTRFSSLRGRSMAEEATFILHAT